MHSSACASTASDAQLRQLTWPCLNECYHVHAARCWLRSLIRFLGSCRLLDAASVCSRYARHDGMGAAPPTQTPQGSPAATERSPATGQAPPALDALCTLLGALLEGPPAAAATARGFFRERLAGPGRIGAGPEPAHRVSADRDSAVSGGTAVANTVALRVLPVMAAAVRCAWAVSCSLEV